MPVRSWASAAPIAVDTVPSMPATPRLDRTRMPSVSRPTSADVADRVGRPQHQLVAGPQRVGHGGGNVQAGGQRVRRELVPDRCAARAGSPPRNDAATPDRVCPLVTARVPVACELPETSGQRGPVVSA